MQGVGGIAHEQREVADPNLCEAPSGGFVDFNPRISGLQDHFGLDSAGARAGHHAPIFRGADGTWALKDEKESHIPRVAIRRGIAENDSCRSISTHSWGARTREENSWPKVIFVPNR